MHHRNPGPSPPACEPDGQGRRRGRRPRPGRQGSPTRCSCWAVRPAAALRRSRPRRSLPCWRGLPPTRPPARPGPRLPPLSAGPSGRDRRCQLGRGQSRRARQGRPVPARRRGRAGAGCADTQAEPARPARQAGRRGGWRVTYTDPTAVRVQAVGLVGAGRPVGEVAPVLGVHPAAVRRWGWQAWRGWGSAMGLTQSDSLDPPG